VFYIAKFSARFQFFFSISSTECFIGITPEASFPFHRPHMFDTNRWRGAAGRGPCFFPNFPLILPIPLLCLDHGRSLVILSGRSFVCTAFGNSHFIYATCCPETCCQKSCESLSLTTSTNGDASLSLSLSVPPGQFNFSSLPPRQTVYLLICVLASPRPSCSSVYK